MMSKGLEALETMISNGYVNPNVEELKVIETALNDYNAIINNKYHISNPLAYISYAEETLGMFNLDSGEELRNVLRIIKDKCLKIDFKTLLASTDYEAYCFTLNSTRYITKQEYELLKKIFSLKEVLL